MGSEKWKKDDFPTSHLFKNHIYTTIVYNHAGIKFVTSIFDDKNKNEHHVITNNCGVRSPAQPERTQFCNRIFTLRTTCLSWSFCRDLGVVVKTYMKKRSISVVMGNLSVISRVARMQKSELEWQISFCLLDSCTPCTTLVQNLRSFYLSYFRVLPDCT